MGRKRGVILSDDGPNAWEQRICVLSNSEGKTLLMASLLFLSAVLLWGGEYIEEGVKVEEGSSAKEQGESSEPEKELNASATETEVPMEVSGLLVCLMQLQMSLLLPPSLCCSAAEVSSWNGI